MIIRIMLVARLKSFVAPSVTQFVVSVFQVTYC